MDFGGKLDNQMDKNIAAYNDEQDWLEEYNRRVEERVVRLQKEFPHLSNTALWELAEDEELETIRQEREP